MTSLPFFPILPITLFLLILLHSHSIPTVESSTLNPMTQTSNNTDFIRASCNTTLYPDLCFTSLSGYARAVQDDPARLARAAIIVSLSRANHMTAYLSNVSSQSDFGTEAHASAALHDCSSVFSDAVDQIHGSLRQMGRLGKETTSVQFQLSNVQTWMSSALTNEETCTDGFGDVKNTEIKTDVCDRADKVKEVTSNALALVNSYVSTVTSP